MEYKNILWIDDLDINSDIGNIEDDLLENEKNGIENDNIEIIRDYFGNRYVDVNLIKEFMSAIQELEENNTKYDLIVFDIDMKSSMEHLEFEEIKKRLKRNRVVVNKTCTWSEFCQTTGIYLYLYLLNMGYPNNRMVFLTGNDTKTPCEILEAAHICVDESNLVTKSGGEIKNKEWISNYYTDEYYIVRRMVYKACEYWKECLQKNEKIAFNSVYYDKDEFEISREMFINMLERLKLLFSVIKPYDIASVYYQALQVVTMFHEESAKIEKLKNDPGIKKYHQSVRNFRNWSAHNKFLSNKINSDFFIYIFCITLRTYFVFVKADIETNKQVKIEEEEKENWYTVYEKDALQFILSEKSIVKHSDYKEYYKLDWKRHFERVMHRFKKNIWVYKDITSLLLESGNCDNKNDNGMVISDCIFNLLKEPMKLDGQWKTVGIGYEYSIQYEWKCEKSVDANLYDTLVRDVQDSSILSSDLLVIFLYLKIHKKE